MKLSSTKDLYWDFITALGFALLFTYPINYFYKIPSFGGKDWTNIILLFSVFFQLNRLKTWVKVLYENTIVNLNPDLKEGDFIEITWLPDNRGVRNAYIGMKGKVTDLKQDGTFVLETGSSLLIVNEKCKFIKHES